MKKNEKKKERKIIKEKKEWTKEERKKEDQKCEEKKERRETKERQKEALFPYFPLCHEQDTHYVNNKIRKEIVKDIESEVKGPEKLTEEVPLRCYNKKRKKIWEENYRDRLAELRYFKQAVNCQRVLFLPTNDRWGDQRFVPFPFLLTIYVLLYVYIMGHFFSEFEH